MEIMVGLILAYALIRPAHVGEWLGTIAKSFDAARKG